MTKLLKRCLALLAAGTLVLGSVAMAAATDTVNNDVMLISQAVSQNAKLYVEGKLISSTAVQSGDTTMIPLRAVCENMGYNVQWDAQAKKITLTRGAQYITIDPSEDGYTFSKTAPMKLGKAPMNKDGYTYVPLHFIDEVLEGKVVTDTNFIYLTTQDLTDKITLNGEVKNREDGSITIGLEGIDDPTKTIVLHMTEDTTISYKDGKALPLSAVEKGDKVCAVFDKAMTRSIPPQSNAISIVVTKETKTENTEQPVLEESQKKSMYYGTVSEVKDGAIYMDGKDMQAQLIVHVADDTVLRNKEGKTVALDTIKEGTFLAIEKGAAMTMSIPPQTTAVAIDEIQYETITGKVLSVENDQVVLAQKDTDGSTPDKQFILNTNEDTKIYDKTGAFITVDSLKKGDTIEAMHSMATTMSLPAQSFAYTISVK